jgi:bacterial/archaeal transporter family protein
VPLWLRPVVVNFVADAPRAGCLDRKGDTVLENTTGQDGAALGLPARPTEGEHSMIWLLYAFVSAGAAAATAILAKVGIEGVPSNLATAVRAVVITAFAWSVAIATGEHHAIATTSRRSLVFLLLSGVAAGVSWIAYFRALQLAPASRVAPIDKLSLPLTVLLAGVILGESIGWRIGAGVALMTAGAILTIG